MTKQHRMNLALALMLALALLLPCVGAAAEGLGLTPDTKEATQYTIDANEQVYALLDFDDERELENAQRGLIAAPDSLVNTDANLVRTMWGVRTHEGAADVVGGPVTEPTIVIKTGLFSSYTLAVRDDEVGGKGDGSFEGDRLAPMAHTAPTGDPFAAAIPASAIIAGVAALFVLAGRMGVRGGRKKEL